jgi:MFS family permease
MIGAQPLGGPRGLPGVVWLLLAGDLCTAVGIGLTQPYTVVLLHDVWFVPLATATAIVSLAALASLVGNPVAGTLIDRFGSRAVMLAGLATALVGVLTLAVGAGALAGGVGVALTGLGWSLTIPALATRIATLVMENARSRVFTLQYTLFNVGMAVGAATAGIVIAVAPHRMASLWLVAGATCVVAAVTVTLAGTSAVGRAEAMTGRGYRSVLDDGVLRRVLAAAVLLATVGYGMFNALPQVLSTIAHDPAALTWLSVANCVTVVVFSPVAMRAASFLPTRVALFVTAGLWGLAWAICVPAMYGAGPSVRAVLTLTAVLIGAGELLLAGALPTMVNALAPDSLRGRYNALLSLSLTAGMAAGPLLTSAATVSGELPYLAYLAVAMVAGAALLLRPRLTPRLLPPAVPAEAVR